MSDRCLIHVNPRDFTICVYASPDPKEFSPIVSQQTVFHWIYHASLIALSTESNTWSRPVKWGDDTKLQYKHTYVERILCWSSCKKELYITLTIKSGCQIISLLISCHRFNSASPSDAQKGQWIGSALVQIMACRLFGAKPLTKPMLCYLLSGPLRTTFSEIWIERQNFLFTKLHLKYRLRNGAHFVQEEMN